MSVYAKSWEDQIRLYSPKTTKFLNTKNFIPTSNLPSRRIIHLSIRNNLKGQDRSLCADTDADTGRDSSLRKIRG